MISRFDLTNYLQNLLDCNNFNDYAPNGLQVEGNARISSICTAVTASASIIDEASRLKADALLVHHGYFWRGEDSVITGIKYQRISRLIESKMNLLAYHLPLDCHAELGNNACIGKLLDLQSITRHPASKTPDLLWAGSFPKAITASACADLLQDRFKRAPLLIDGGNSLINRIAWCSGGAQDFITEAHALGADAYISGEVSERTYYLAKELGIHYFSCGHHATERFGIQALGEHIAHHFNIPHRFLDCENPI